MISIDAGQLQLAERGSIWQATLVRITTYSNVLTSTVQQVHNWATAPLLYQWTPSVVDTFLPALIGATPIVRSFPHIPDGATLATRDGVRLTIDGRAQLGDFGENLWNVLSAQTLVGARVEIGTLLLDQERLGDARWWDLSALAAVHVVRWRGEVTSIDDFDWESGRIVIACDTIEPSLSWPRALNDAANERRDLGKRYPIPLGFARLVELVGIQVGAATTLVTDVAATGTTPWAISDGSGFPRSGTYLVKCGDEIVSVFGPSTTDTELSIVARAQSGTVAARHSKGATVIELVREARYALSAREIRACLSVYWELSGGQLVRLDPSRWGFNPAAPEVESGQTLAVVSFDSEQLAAAIEDVAAIIQQPEFGQLATVESVRLDWQGWGFDTSASQSVGPSVSCNAATFADNPAGMQVFYQTSAPTTQTAVFWSTLVDSSIDPRVVRRIRPVFDLLVVSSGTSGQATKVYYEVDQFQLPGFPSYTLSQAKTLLVSQSGSNSTRQVIAGAWMTPSLPDLMTCGDLVASGATPINSQLHCNVYLDQTSGGVGGSTSAFVYATSSYWEVETDPLPISQTLPADTVTAWGVGNGLRLLADARGLVQRSAEAAISSLDFTSTAAWNAGNCTISTQTIGGRQGIRLASPTNVAVALVHTGLSLNWSAAGASMSFEVYVTAANRDKLNSAGFPGRYFEFRAMVNATDGYAYPFGPADLIDDAWTTITVDLTWHSKRVTLGAGAGSLSAITRVEFVAVWDSTTGAPQIHFRNARSMTRSYLDHAIDVGQYVIEQLAGLTGAVDASAASTAKTNLPNVILSGDLRRLGEGFPDILARLSYESRTNWLALEGASGTIYRPLAALSPSHAWPAAVRTFAASSLRRIVATSRTFDELVSRFSAIYDYRPSQNASDVSAYRASGRVDEQLSTLASVLTSDIAAAQVIVGIRQGTPQEFLAIGEAAPFAEVWGYYIHEALRYSARRYSFTVAYQLGYDLELGDVVGVVTPWDGTIRKGRVVRLAFPLDAPGIGLTIEEVP